MKIKQLAEYARQFGAEAFANGRQYMSLDDREDIATYYGEDWYSIPDEHQKILTKAFYNGVKAEKEHHK